jgi:hypothetical protein
MVLYKRYVCLPYFKNDSGGERRIDFNFRAHLMRLKKWVREGMGVNLLTSAASTYAPPMINGDKIEKLVMAESSTSH